MTMPFKKDAGSKSLYETITAVLRNDAVLKGLVNYTPKNANIRRGFQPDGEWKTLVLYYLQPDIIFTDFTPKLRQVPLVVQMWARENELCLYDIGERIVDLLDHEGSERDVTKEGFTHVYDCTYGGDVIGLRYDTDKQAYNRALRFLITFRKED